MVKSSPQSPVAPTRKLEQYVLRVLKHDLELAEVPLSGRDIAIGRSPTCDAVLRVKGVAPIQFLVSKMSPKTWFVVDLAAGKGEPSSVELHEGKSHILSGYRFDVVKRVLQGSDYKKGVMQAALESNEPKPKGPELKYLTDKWLLQIIELRGDSRVPENIHHVAVNNKDFRKDGVYPISGLPMKARLVGVSGGNSKCVVDCSSLSAAEFFKQGMPCAEASLEAGQVLRIDWMSRSYYFRFVNEIALPPLQRGWEGDRFLAQLLGWVFLPLVVLLILWLSFSEPTPPKPREAERIARIEVLPALPMPEPELPTESVDAGAPQTSASSSRTSSRSNSTQRSAPQRTQNNSRGRPTSSQPKASSPAAPRAEEAGLLGLIGGASGGQQVAVDNSLSRMSPNERARLQVRGQSGEGAGVAGGASNLRQGGGLTSAQRGVGGPSGADVAGATGNIGGGLNAGRGTGLGGRGGGRGGIGGLDGGSVGEAGGLDKDAVQRVVRENAGRLRLCYEQALVSNPSLRGKVSFDWTIRPEGSVQRVSVASSELAAPLMESCLTSIIQQMRFPRAPNGKPTKVIYPFVFAPN